MMFKQMNHLQQRLIGGTIAALLSLTIIMLSQVPAFKPIAIAFITFSIAFAMWEFYHIAQVKGLQPASSLGISTGVIYALAVGLSTQYSVFKLLPEVALLAILISFFAYYFIKGTSPFLNIASTLFGFIYLAVPLSCLISITYFFTLDGTQDSRWWIAYLIIVTKITDTAAFIVGRNFGSQKLAPYISPNKSLEGAFGGLLGAIAASILLVLLADIADASFELTLWESIWLGAAIGCLAQFGDLAESLLKRDGGIKDSNQLPGLGGVLDVVDSLVFTAPLVYVFLKA